ncbi:Putative helicase [hydrothermal vent metagenome]|uniref:Helicase n=1 Tax=hydrothermal vent metagenome TaxID=652676 RepID=A0A3B1BNL6_9ZZZZ
MSNRHNELARLHTENSRLITLLESHGIEWRLSQIEPRTETAPSPLTTNEKVKLFRRLFQERSDVYPIRWESKAGKSGYSPACANEWKQGICNKPRIKCADCSQRSLLSVTDQTIFDHLAGKHTIGVYPLLNDDTCHFLAVDFDKADWQEDVGAFVASCHELGVPIALEISRSGNGAHAWIFFSSMVSARDARRLGSAIISHTCDRTRQLALGSYDRLFPNQDTMPKGGFGNLIALPLQKKPREQGCSLFVDDAFQPYPDQWIFLASIQPMSPQDIEPAILLATGNRHPLDVTFIGDEDLHEPWKRPTTGANKLAAPMPESVNITLANLIYFEKEQLPQPLLNRLIRLAAFQNPEFYKAQAMRFPVWDKPRVIGCAENFPRHIGLPRGCLEPSVKLLQENGIQCCIEDERSSGQPIQIRFEGKLRDDQEHATKAMLKHDTGILCAPTAFGKTVTGAALIARRGVNTLILVHRTELLKQWKARLQTFLNVKKGDIGTMGGGKVKPSGIIDIAVMQTLTRREELLDQLNQYGQVIVDECHHLSAFSFERILKRTNAKYVLGLTATPIRRDGQQPIIYMQCGPIRHTADIPKNAPRELMIIPHYNTSTIDISPDSPIQEIFRHIAADRGRAESIVEKVTEFYNQGRKVLVLTERIDHLEMIKSTLSQHIQEFYTLHGRMSKKQRAVVTGELDALPPDAPRILLATGKLVGEGFDHPPLDSLVLAMPISWKGTLQQYAGRLHREHTTKNDVRIIDIVDTGHPALLKMWDRRQQGYRTMGYRLVESGTTQDLLPTG